MKSTHTHDPYEHYAEVYDELKGSRADTVRLLQDFLVTYHPYAESILELACGTGSILQGMLGLYKLTGLDISPSMLKLAREKLPHIPFIHEDMVDFRVQEKFDAIYCVHNSVNHLLLFSEWKKLFTTAAHHLSERGLFVFEINPEAKLELMTSSGYGTFRVNDDYIITSVTKDAHKVAHYDWHMQIFEHESGSGYKMHHQIVKVVSYPIEQITEALSAHFDVVEVRMIENAASYEDIGRAYFVCIKK